MKNKKEIKFKIKKPQVPSSAVHPQDPAAPIDNGCFPIWEELQRSWNGKIIWGVLQPILLGTIYYTPDTQTVRRQGDIVEEGGGGRVGFDVSFFSDFFTFDSFYYYIIILFLLSFY